MRARAPELNGRVVIGESITHSTLRFEQASNKPRILSARSICIRLKEYISIGCALLLVRRCIPRVVTLRIRYYHLLSLTPGPPGLRISSRSFALGRAASQPAHIEARHPRARAVTPMKARTGENTETDS
jgi:hypothetical protein